MGQGEGCRHEYVKIFQRRLKGLERRLVATRAYLPVGFKMGDFGHLGEGSYCFCTRCRTRLYPRRTQAEKSAARARAASAQAAEGLEESVADEAAVADVHVEELELEAIDMQDIEAEGVKLTDDETTCQLSEE